MKFPTPPFPDFATGGTYPAGSHAWSGQPVRVAPVGGTLDGGSGITPGKRIPAQNMNHLIGGLGDYFANLRILPVTRWRTELGTAWSPGALGCEVIWDPVLSIFIRRTVTPGVGSDVQYSKDRKIWTSSGTFPSGGSTDVVEAIGTNGAGTVLAVVHNGTIAVPMRVYKSTDGIAYTLTATLDATQVLGPAWLYYDPVLALWVVSAVWDTGSIISEFEPYVAYSSDGVTWTRSADLPGQIASFACIPRLAGNGAGLLVIAEQTTGLVWRSIDGTSWQRAQVPPGAPLLTLCYADAYGCFFGVDSGSGLWQSFNGNEWTSVVQVPVTAGHAAGMAFGNGALIVGDGAKTGVFAYSLDGGKTWGWRTELANPIQQVSFARGQFFAGCIMGLSGVGLVYSSRDFTP